MLSTTKSAIKAIMSADPTIDQGNVSAALRAEERAANGAIVTDELPSVVKRQELAQKLGVTPARVDQIAATGGLVRITTPGAQRSVGFTHESAMALLQGRTK